jgi:hypothetical protein
MRKIWNFFRGRKEGLRAHIDHVQNGMSVSGWALDRQDPSRRLELEILLDGHPAARVVADSFRSDLKAAFGSDGCHAFTTTLDLSGIPLREGRITLREAGNDRMIGNVEAFCGFDREFWNDFNTMYRTKLSDGLTDPYRSLWQESKLKDLLETLYGQGTSKKLSGEEMLLLLGLALALGEYPRASRVYQDALQDKGVPALELNRVLLLYCRPLWNDHRDLEKRTEVSEVRKIEFLIMAFPQWVKEDLKIDTGSPALLLARLIRSGYLADMEAARRLASLWSNDPDKSIVEYYGRLLPIVRELHRYLIVGKYRGIAPILQRMGSILSDAEGCVLPMATSAFGLMTDTLAFLSRQEFLEKQEISMAMEFLQGKTVTERFPFYPKEKEHLSQLLQRSSREDQKRSVEIKVKRGNKKIELLQLRRATLPMKEEDIACFLVQRNEGMRLEGFFEYYRQLGVKRFYVVDNASDDERTLDILMKQDDVELFETSQSYGASRYGIDWVEALLKRFRKEGSWNLVVDADELLVLKKSTTNLSLLSRQLESNGRDALGVPLLDVYSRGPIRQASYRPGLEILEECRWYDARFFTTYSPYGGPNFLDPIFQGGVRSRAFGIDSVVLNKVPFFRYSADIQLQEGMHWIDGGRVEYGQGVLLHFKYLSTFHRYAEEEARRGEHWNGASEYRRYHEALSQSPDFTLYHPVFSVEFESVEKFFSSYPPEGLWALSEGEVIEC